jgi:putative two-component system response regulator
MHGYDPHTFSELTDNADGTGSTSEMQATILALGQAVEQRDEHTGTHCKRLAYRSVAIGVCLGLDRDSLVALYRGGYLHDVGKVGIPDAILLKPGKLTDAEWTTMRTHTTRGEEICRHLKSLAPVLPIIRHHHERWDGSGYPDGLRENQIPLLARVLQVADIYDALTNPRPYREACTPAQAIETLRQETARGWRDPEVLRAFLSLHREASMQASLASLGRSLQDSCVPGNSALLPISVQ